MSHLLSFSLQFFWFFIYIAAQPIPTDYPTCPSYKCGHLNISYPFWRIDDDQPQFCGYQGLGISCSNINGTDRPIINFVGVPYFVEKIIYDRIVLVDYEVSSIFPIADRIYCPVVRRNIYFQSLPINFTPSNIDVSFHFNCNRVPSFATDIPCLETDSGGRKSCFNRPDAEPEDFDWSNYSCDDNVVKTVLRNPALPDGGDGLETDYREVLSRGFELKYWGRMESCDPCEISGGRCGYNNRTAESMCFCSDGRTTTDNCKTKGINWRLILAIGFGSGVTILSLMLVFKIYCIANSPSSICISAFKHKTEDEKRVEAFITQYGSLGMKRYSYVDIKKMTNSFEVELGKGGFGTVFKGKLSDGRLVAVKVLNSSKASGREFINEVASIGSTSHVNIVSLLGFCFEYKKRSLVYEFMPNGSLDKFIIRRVPLEISEHIGVHKLHDVALGIARGLDYLHHGCNTRILHLDIKPHNILLDEDFCPKIADFGLAKLYSRKESMVSMLEARGTIGYIAPEVFNRNFGRVSHKSDVYSYGMLILEMVGGRKNDDIDVGFENTSEIYFPDWIYNRLKMDEFLLDGVKTIEENEYARKMVIVGLWCIQNNPTQRPSINEVIEMLEGSMESLKIPPKPLFYSPPRSRLTTFNISPEVSQDDCILVTT